MMSMELSEFVHPFVLAQCDPAALGELCKAMGGVSRGVFVKLNEILADRESRRFSKLQRIKAWLELYRLGGFQPKKRLLEKANWFPAYIKLLLSMDAPGAKDMRNLRGNIEKETSVLRGNKMIIEALENDNFAEFILRCDIVGRELTRPIIRELIESSDYGNVCEGLILRYPQTFKMFPAREIALAICACCQSEEKSVRLIRALAKVFPGISGIVDVNGWTPLTYTLFRQKASGGYLRGVYRGKNDAPTLEKLLIELGCDPNAKDKYGLSWREIRAVLPRACKVNEA